MRGERDRPVRRLFRLGLHAPAPDEATEWEIEHHLAEVTDRLVEEGWSPEAAAREAERRFGAVPRHRARLSRMERRRTAMARTGGFLVAAGETLWAGVRCLRRQPGLTAAVVAVLGLGVGANAAMFTVLDRIFFQPPAHVVDADAVRRVVVARPGRDGMSVSSSHADYQDLETVAGIEAVATYAPQEVTRGRGEEATRLRAVIASHTLFPLLGVKPELGRFYGPDDDRVGAPPVVVVSHEYWKRALGGDPEVLGTTLDLAGEPFTVVGVAPRGFTGPDLAPVDAWLPLLTGGVVVQGWDQWIGGRNFYWLRIVVRLAPGAAPAAVEKEATARYLNARAKQVAKGFAATIRLEPLVLARSDMATSESKVARWLGGVSLLLLLIVCANVTNLLLARGTRRRREVAVRLALGVSRRRLVAGAVLEMLLLGTLGAAAALAVALWGGAAIRRLLLPGVLFPVALGGRVVAFTLALALVAGALAGIGPALQAARLDLVGDMGLGTRGAVGRSRVRDALTVGQGALSVLLLVGAGLFVRSVGRVHDLDLGLDVDRVVQGTLELSGANVVPVLPADPDQLREQAREQNALYARAMDAVGALPGVERAAAGAVPFQWAFGSDLKVPGWDSLPSLPGGGPYYYDVTPGYAATVGLKVLRGRPLAATDDAAAPSVALVSETMAATLWPGDDALGRCLLVGGDDAKGCTTVVGVVEDASRGELEDPPFMAYYLPVAQREGNQLRAIFVRAAPGTDAATLVGPVARTLRTLDPRIRFADVQTLRSALDPQARSWRLGAALFSAFGLLALLVSSIGLYGLLAFHVAQRTRELGIRSALGAARRRLMGDVVGAGARLTLLGVAAGLAAALALGRFAEPLLFQESPRDPVVLAGVALTLLVVGILASLLPGVRATRVDPMEALRTE